MARRLFPGAWLRKPHYVQVGRQRAVPRGGRVGPAPAPFPPGSRLHPAPPPRSYLRSGRPPQGSPLPPAQRGRGRRSLPPAPGGGRGSAAGRWGSAARPAGGCGAGADASRGRRAPWRQVSGHGCRWRRAAVPAAAPPAGRIELLLPPPGCSELRGASSSRGPRCSAAGRVTRQPARRLPRPLRTHERFSVGQLHRRHCQGPEEALCFSPHISSLHLSPVLWISIPSEDGL